MNRQNYKQYTKERPYKVWIKRSNGTKFLAHFKNKNDADKYTTKVNHTYTKANITTKKTVKKRSGNTGYAKLLWG